MQQRNQNKLNMQKGAALAMTVMVVTIILVIVQSMVVLSQSRARLTAQADALRAAERVAMNGLECGMGQVIFQQALAGGEPSNCMDEAITFTPATFEDYELGFVVWGDGATCAEILLRQNKTDDYTIRADGYLVCDGSGPVSGGVNQERVVRLMDVTQTDEGEVESAVVRY